MRRVGNKIYGGCWDNDYDTEFMIRWSFEGEFVKDRASGFRCFRRSTR